MAKAFVIQDTDVATEEKPPAESVFQSRKSSGPVLLNHGSSPQSEEEAILLAGDVSNSQRLNRSNEDIDVDEPMTHLQGAIMQHREEKKF